MPSKEPEEGTDLLPPEPPRHSIHALIDDLIRHALDNGYEVIILRPAVPQVAPPVPETPSLPEASDTE
jgi:hypothetical protein